VDLPGLLRANAATCARVALENISREFPSDVHHTMTGRVTSRSGRESGHRSSSVACAVLLLS